MGHFVSSGESFQLFRNNTGVHVHLLIEVQECDADGVVLVLAPPTRSVSIPRSGLALSLILSANEAITVRNTGSLVTRLRASLRLADCSKSEQD